jgi:hypothetical protein
MPWESLDRAMKREVQHCAEEDKWADLGDEESGNEEMTAPLVT